MINITFPDNSVRQFEAGVTPLDIAKSLSEGLARNVLSAKVNGKMWDAMRPVNEDAAIQLFTWDDPEGKATFWHSSAFSQFSQAPSSLQFSHSWPSAHSPQQALVVSATASTASASPSAAFLVPLLLPQEQKHRAAIAREMITFFMMLCIKIGLTLKTSPQS